MLEQLIKKKLAKIIVIGTGYVGLPLIISFGRKGFAVTGYDVDEEKIKLLNQGFDPTLQRSNSVLKKLVKIGKINFTTNPAVLKNSDIIIICVPTPLKKNLEPDLFYIRQAVKTIKKNFRKGQLIILESTSYPGTTEEEILSVLQKENFIVGRDFFLAFSPERIDPGNRDFSLNQIPKVVGGVTKKCTSLAGEIYKVIFDKVYLASSPKVAEMEKLLENIFRSVNIALVNELAILCKKMDIDIWEVIELASTKPYGFMPFYPGPGLGGHCIPVDPFYLNWKAKQYSFPTRFIELAGEINRWMPHYVISLVKEALKKKNISLKNSKILVLGVTYKKDVPDTRESPALEIIHLLNKKKAKVFYHDPFIKKIKIGRKNYYSVNLNKNLFYDCLLLITNHSSYNIKELVRKSKIFVDTRGVTRKLKSKKIVRL